MFKNIPRYWVAGLVLAVLWAPLCSPVAAQDPEMKHLDLLDLPGKWWKHDRAVAALKLTPAQIEQIDAIFLEHRKNLVDSKARLEKLLLDFQQLSDQAEVNRERTIQLVDQIAQARAEMVRTTVLMQLDIRERLTPEQRIALKQLKEEFKGEMRRRIMERHKDGEAGRQRAPGRPGY